MLSDNAEYRISVKSHDDYMKITSITLMFWSLSGFIVQERPQLQGKYWWFLIHVIFISRCCFTSLKNVLNEF